MNARKGMSNWKATVQNATRRPKDSRAIRQARASESAISSAWKVWAAGTNRSPATMRSE